MQFLCRLFSKLDHLELCFSCQFSSFEDRPVWQCVFSMWPLPQVFICYGAKENHWEQVLSLCERRSWRGRNRSSTSVLEFLVTCSGIFIFWNSLLNLLPFKSLNINTLRNRPWGWFKTVISKYVFNLFCCILSAAYVFYL